MPDLEYRTSFGLTLTIEYAIAPAEPDVGIMRSYVDEWYITHIGSRRLKPNEKIGWLYKKLRNTLVKRHFSASMVSEYELIEEACEMDH